MMKMTERVSGLLMAVLLTLSMHAAAAPQTAGSDFNHATTGFALTGGHATAACETCHVGGVFKGTSRNCDGCHAVGKRVVATPKSSSHIVTDAPCETCHFNSSTWLGARYNHGTAKPGSCQTCHNGRLSITKPASHNTGSKATNSCDQCHRTYAWLPATWNHTGVGSCDQAGCHVSGSNPYFKSPSTHSTIGMGTFACADCHNYFAWSPARYKHNTGVPCSNCHSNTTVLPQNRKPTSHSAVAIKGINPCGDCHSVQAWLPATYRHTGAGTCSSCHDGIKAQGKGSTHGYTIAECSTCHTGTTTWLGASYHNGNVTGVCGTCHNGTGGVKGTSATHIPLTTGGNPNCDLCHTSTTTFTAYTMNHGGITTCNTCHASTSVYAVTTKRVIGNHQGSTAGQDCRDCHTSTSTWSGALGSKPANHIPYNTGAACGSCHSSAMSGPALHAYLTTKACTTCHLRGNAYPWGQDTKSVGHEGMKAGDDCSKSGCHRPLGSKGTAYIIWD